MHAESIYYKSKHICNGKIVGNFSLYIDFMSTLITIRPHRYPKFNIIVYTTKINAQDLSLFFEFYRPDSEFL